MSPQRETAESTPPEETAVYWFVILDLSRDRGDFTAAANAQAELKRLGVDVRFRRTQGKQRQLANV